MRPALTVIAVIASTGCFSGDTASPSPRPVYDLRSRQLVRLDWDADGDGRVDQRTYFVGGQAARSEVDEDGDGRIDRWEYVNGVAAVSSIGRSSANDGIEDTWIWTADAAGEVRIDRAQYRDRIIDRREFLRDDILVRAEEDADRDGLTDKWETWERGALVTAAFDTTFSTGRPDRRLVYASGRLAYLEADVDGTGHFKRLASNQPGSGDTTRDRH